MADLADVRRIALRFPRAYEALVREYVKFRVGRLVFASVSPDESLLGVGYPREERDSLVASDPQRFLLPVASDLRYQWVRCRLPLIGVDELGELLLDAWRMCVPRSVAAEFLG